MEDPELEMRRVMSRLGDQLDRMRDYQDRLSELEGSGEAADGRVNVTVGPSGALTGIQIDPRALRLGSQELGEAILQAAQNATQSVSDKMQELLGEFGAANAGDDLAKLATGDVSMFGANKGSLGLPHTGDSLQDAREVLRRFMA